MIKEYSDVDKQEQPISRKCPDQGICHHNCQEGVDCWRMKYCLPLESSCLDHNWKHKSTISLN